MANQNPQNSGGGNSGLAFIVGALVVAVGVMAYVMYSGGGSDDADISISLDGAGDAVEEAVSGN